MAAMLRPRREPTPDEPSSAAVTINAAFFQEVKEVQVEVSDTLRGIILLQQQTPWTNLMCQKLVGDLHRLLELVELSFSLEEDYGYFENPAFVESGYANRVSALRDEHRALGADLSRLCDHVSRLERNGGLASCADAVMARFYAFCDQLAAHEYCEKVLITEALRVDVGCVD
jgi:hypothetical protein